MVRLASVVGVGACCTDWEHPRHSREGFHGHIRGISGETGWLLCFLSASLDSRVSGGELVICGDVFGSRTCHWSGVGCCPGCEVLPGVRVGSVYCDCGGPVRACAWTVWFIGLSLASSWLFVFDEV